MTGFTIELVPGFALELGRLPRTVAAALERFLVGAREVQTADERPSTLDLVGRLPGPRVASRPVAGRDGVSIVHAEDELYFSAPNCQARLARQSVELWLDEDSPAAVLELVSLLLPAVLLELAWSRDVVGIHAAGLAIGGRGVLLPGPSGCGKSTIFTRAGKSDLDLLSDDLVWIDAREGRWRLRPFPRGEPFAPAPPPTVDEAPLAVVVFPEIVDRDRSEVVRLGRGECLHRLLSEVSLLAPSDTADRFRRLAALADGIPGFVLLAGRDRDSVPVLLRRLAESSGGGMATRTP